jgi:hypothetical protein
MSSAGYRALRLSNNFRISSIRYDFQSVKADSRNLNNCVVLLPVGGDKHRDEPKLKS